MEPVKGRNMPQQHSGHTAGMRNRGRVTVIYMQEVKVWITSSQSSDDRKTFTVDEACRFKHLPLTTNLNLNR